MTIFEKIIQREIPASIVYEDSVHIVFLDINPVTKGHLLVVPKKVYPWIQDMPESEYLDLMRLVKNIITPLKNTTDSDYVHIVVEGKDVPHVHVHMIPRTIDDHASHMTHTSYQGDELATYVSTLTEALAR